MVWTKLELDQQGRKEELQWILDGLIGMRSLDFSNGLPSYPAKEPVDIVADFLRKVRETVLGFLARPATRATFDRADIDLVVTEPAVTQPKSCHPIRAR